MEVDNPLASQPTPLLPNSSPSTPAPTSNKSNRSCVIIALSFGSLALLACAGIVLCSGLFGVGFFKTWQEQGNIAPVIDKFLVAMSNKDTHAAYDLISTRGRRHITTGQIENFVEGNNYKVFEDYQSLEIINFNITLTGNTNPDMPQGTVATVRGTVQYSNGYTGQFQTTLEQEDGQWKIFGFNVVAPPDKFGP